VYAQRNYKEALRLFQDVLRYNPACVPDPRIGIGLCFWAMDQKAKAKAAWHRSLEVVCNEYLVKVHSSDNVTRIPESGLRYSCWAWNPSMLAKMII
jgi:hypothetical protein